MIEEVTVYQVARAFAIYIATIRNLKSVDRLELINEARVVLDWIMEGKRPKEDK